MSESLVGETRGQGGLREESCARAISLVLALALALSLTSQIQTQREIGGKFDIQEGLSAVCERVCQPG